MKEFWALRQPDGEYWTIAEKHSGTRHIATFATEDEAVEYSEGTPQLDYAVAVKFVQVAR